MVRKILSFILFFLYVANIQFVFLPDRIRTRLVVSVIGLLYYFFQFGGKDCYKIKNVALLIVPLTLSMLMSMVVNQSSQYWFLQYVALQLIFMFGAVFVIDYGRLQSLPSLLFNFLIYVCIQDIIAFVSFQVPMVASLMRMVQVSELSDERMQLFEMRAVGFGEFVVFGGGVWIAIGLLCLTLLYKLKRIKTFFFVAIYIFLLGTGLFVARTSLTGFFSLILLLFPLKKGWYKVALMVVFVGIIFVSLQYLSKNFESRGLNTSYAYEIFNKFSDSGELQSNSYDSTRRMWKILPASASTWIIGDAKYEDERGGYYMHTDVGYLRVIFYGGLIGLFFYLLYIFKIAKLTYLRSGRNDNIKYFMGIYYVMVLLWMWKGHFDTNCFIYLFLFSKTLRGNLSLQMRRLGK